MQVKYEDKSYQFDLAEMTLAQCKVMASYGVPNLVALETGLHEADLLCLTVAFWVMQCQSGDDSAIETVNFKPLKFVQAIAAASREDAGPKGQ